MNSKQKDKCADFEKVDKAIYTCLNDNRSQQMKIDRVILKEKAVEFAKAFGKTKFKASDFLVKHVKGNASCIVFFFFACSFSYLFIFLQNSLFNILTSFLSKRYSTNTALGYPCHHQD